MVPRRAASITQAAHFWSLFGRFGVGTLGLERAEVYLSTRAFEPHRHDTYAIGITTQSACRPSATAARAESAFPVSCTSSTPTRRTTAQREPRTASATESSTSRPK